MERGARTWMTRVRSGVWLSWVSLSFNNNTARSSWLLSATFRPSNLTSHFSVPIAGESSILVVAPGESMRVYSLLQLPMVESASLEAIQLNLALNSLIITAWPLHSLLSISSVPSPTLVLMLRKRGVFLVNHLDVLMPNGRNSRIKPKILYWLKCLHCIVPGVFWRMISCARCSISEMVLACVG